jgi:SAM-dependent methyltransferase
MDLNKLSRHWDHLAQNDPMWAILSFPGKRAGKWEPQEFFASGTAEIARVMERLNNENLGLGRHRALDFGSGLGRLTQALAGYFDEAIGVDIAPAMIKGAQEFNSHGDRCTYILNTHADLRLFASNHFDFIYSNIVLQHMKPEYSAAYIREFVRVLAPGGVALFQIPSHPLMTPRGVLMRVLPLSLVRMYRRMDMFGIRKDQVSSIVTSAGAHIRLIEASTDSGPNWVSYRYTVVK